MNIDAIKDFAQKHSISEVTIRLLFVQAINSALVEKYQEYDNVFFNIDTQKIYFIRDTIVTEKSIREIGRRFILVNCNYHLDFLLNQTYPNVFKFSGDVKTKIDKFYEDRNDAKYSSDSYEEGPYCSACQQAPCMCSDREATSTIYDF